MPQTSVLPQWRADYPILTPRQKAPLWVPHSVSLTPSATTWAAGVVTMTVAAVADPVGSTYPITVVGFTPAGYNGSYTGTIASSTSITFPLAANPGAVTVEGTVSYTGVALSTISTTLPANAVPNKAMWAAGTIQIAGMEVSPTVEEAGGGVAEDTTITSDPDTLDEEPTPRTRNRRR